MDRIFWLLAEAAIWSIIATIILYYKKDEIGANHDDKLHLG